MIQSRRGHETISRSHPARCTVKIFTHRRPENLPRSVDLYLFVAQISRRSVKTNVLLLISFGDQKVIKMKNGGIKLAALYAMKTGRKSGLVCKIL